MSMEAVVLCQGFYTPFTRRFLAFGVFFFFGMAAMSIGSALMPPVLVRSIVAMSVISVIFVALGWYGMRLLPFVSARIVLTEDGLHVIKGAEERFHRWGSLSHYVDREGLQVLDVYAKDGARVLSVDHYLFGFAEVRAVIAERVATRAR